MVKNGQELLIASVHGGRSKNKKQKKNLIWIWKKGKTTRIDQYDHIVVYKWVKTDELNPHPHLFSMMHILKKKKKKTRPGLAGMAGESLKLCLKISWYYIT